MRRLLLFSVAFMLAFVVTPALAEPTTDDFLIWMEGPNTLRGPETIGGSGFNDGTGVWGTPWYYYPNTDWYNQWYYDAPPDPARWKKITYSIIVKYAFEIDLTIALNWSTLAYLETGPDGPPPLPPLDPGDELAWIHREVIFSEFMDIPEPETVKIDGTFIIPDYNPEWVSIDFRAYGQFTFVEGTITHECIPAPGAIVLGSIGVGLVGWLRRRRTL